MYGRIMKVSEYELKFGAKEKNVKVFVCFKYLKNGNNYVVFSSGEEENAGKICFGLLHKNMEKGKIVVIEPKTGDSEIIKEAIWKIINNMDLNYYEIISVDDIEKIEIISNSFLDIKSDVISKLEDITIPKKEEVKEEIVKKKGNPILKFFILLLILIVGIGSFLFSYNIGEFLGYGKMLTCQIVYPHSKLEANINRTLTIYYDRKGNMDKLTDNMAYIFNEYDVYYDFKEKGEYFSYQPAGITDGGMKFEDDTNTFRTIVNSKGNEEYYVDDLKISGDIDDDYNMLVSSSYTCVIKNRDE